MKKNKKTNIDPNDASDLKIKCSFEFEGDYKEEIKIRKSFIAELIKFSFRIVPGLGYGKSIYGIIPANKLKEIKKIAGLKVDLWE